MFVTVPGVSHPEDRGQPANSRLAVAGSGLTSGALVESASFEGGAGCTVRGRFRIISTLVPTGREISSPRVNSTLAKPAPAPITAPYPTPARPAWLSDPISRPAP